MFLSILEGVLSVSDTVDYALTGSSSGGGGSSIGRAPDKKRCARQRYQSIGGRHDWINYFLHAKENSVLNEQLAIQAIESFWDDIQDIIRAYEFVYYINNERYACYMERGEIPDNIHSYLTTEQYLSNSKLVSRLITGK